MPPLPTGHDGNTHSFFATSADGWAFDGSKAGLRADFDPQLHRIHVAITDSSGDGRLSGDDSAEEVGEDPAQTAVIRAPDGTVLATGQIYAETVYVLRAPDGTSFQVYELEIGGVFWGYMSTYPAAPGQSFPVVSGTNVVQSNAPSYRELDNIACFGPDVMIDTDEGPVPAAWLTRGDRVLTLDHGYQPLEWVGRSRLDRTAPELVRISPGALGDGCPAFPALVSGQHRLLVRGPELELLFGEPEMLVAAQWLTALRGIDPVPAPPGMSIYHLKLAQHELIRSEGFWSESFLAEAGAQALPFAPIRAVRPALKRWEAEFLFGATKAPAILLHVAA